MKRRAVILCCINLIISVNAQSTDLYYADENIDAYPRASFPRAILYNETIEMYASHTSFFWTPIDFITTNVLSFDFLNSKSHLGIKMKDSSENYVVHVFIEPSARKIFLQCVVEGDLEQGPPASGDSGSNPWKRSYEILVIFTTSGIKLFLGKKYLAEARDCVRRTPEIVGFNIQRKGVYNATLRVVMKNPSVIVPGDWHIRRRIPMGHRIIIEFFPDNRQRKGIVTIRLADRNEIVALTVTIDYKRALLLTKRERYDNNDQECLNFGSSLIYFIDLLGRIEIQILPMFYKIRIETDVSGQTRECTVEGHYMYPYDIHQAIFDASEKESIPYRFYIKQI